MITALLIDFGIGVAGGQLASPGWDDHLLRLAAFFTYGYGPEVRGYY
jgi:hypothetical protein